MSYGSFQVSPTPSSSYLGQLTSLRFLAAMGIFVLHARNHNLIPSDFLSSLNLSNCVSFFFVLSGFIIAYAYDSRSYALSAFYKSRFARIWPAAAFSTLIVLILLPRALYLPDTDNYILFLAILILNLLGLQAWLPVPSVFFSFNAVTWSISVEAFFYLCFPFLQRLRTKKIVLLFLLLSLGLILLSALVTFLSVPFYSRDFINRDVVEGWIYINPLARLPEFLLGIIGFRLFYSTFLSRLTCSFNLLCGSIRSSLSIVFGTTSIICFSYLAFHDLQFGLSLPFELVFNRLLSSLNFLFLILTVSLSRGPLVQLLRSPLLVLLGEISYGVYLYHQPLMIFSVQSGGLKFAGIQILPQSFIVILLATLVLAVASFFWIERPSNRFLRRLT